MRIFVAVLDWGLGHATRSQCLIDQLLQDGHEVWLGSAGQAKTVLEQAYPQLPMIGLPAYGIRYPFRSMLLNMGFQSIKMVVAIVREHGLLRRLQKQYTWDQIISDSRFGCFHPHIPSFIISHQLRLLPPAELGGETIAWLANRVNTWLLKRFTAVWIPDNPPPHSLAGILAVPLVPIITRHLGPLSRLTPLPPNRSVLFDTVILLSGPEPARTHLEKTIWQHPLLGESPQKTLLIRGLPGHEETPAYIPATVTVWGYATQAQLSAVLHPDALVFCRSGYSTIMDLVACGVRRACFFPTPGQSEQEYLAQFHAATFQV